jgi:hypothetical protein
LKERVDSTQRQQAKRTRGKGKAKWPPPQRNAALPHQRFLKRLAIKALTWVVVRALFRLGFLTNGDPRYEHLNKHVWAAGEAGSTLACQTGTCCLDGEPVER